jgi:hypothetical protein
MNLPENLSQTYNVNAEVHFHVSWRVFASVWPTFSPGGVLWTEYELKFDLSLDKTWRCKYCNSSNAGSIPAQVTDMCVHFFITAYHPTHSKTPLSMLRGVFLGLLTRAKFDLTTLFHCIGYLMSNGKMIVNDELERMWKEEIVKYFKVPFLHLPGGTTVTWVSVTGHATVSNPGPST